MRAFCVPEAKRDDPAAGDDGQCSDTRAFPRSAPGQAFGSSAVSIAAGSSSGVSLTVLSGWLSFEPSRYRALALSINCCSLEPVRLFHILDRGVVRHVNGF